MATILFTITFTTYYLQFRLQFTPLMAFLWQQYYLCTITFTTYYLQFRIQFTLLMAFLWQQYYLCTITFTTYYLHFRIQFTPLMAFNGNNNINYYFNYLLFTIYDTLMTFLYKLETKWTSTNHHFNQNQLLHHRDHHYHLHW